MAATLLRLLRSGDSMSVSKPQRDPNWPYDWEPFPTDEMTLTLLESACNINPDTEHTELQRFLNMTGGPVKSVEMDGIEYPSVEAALADHEHDEPPVLTIEVEPGDEPHSEHSVIISLIAEIRRLRG